MRLGFCEHDLEHPLMPLNAFAVHIMVHGVGSKSVSSLRTLLLRLWPQATARLVGTFLIPSRLKNSRRGVLLSFCTACLLPHVHFLVRAEDAANTV